MKQSETGPSRLSWMFEGIRRLWRGRGGLAIRLVLGIAPLVWLAWHVDMREVLAAVVAGGPLPLLAGFAAQLVAVFAGALRWRVLMRAAGVQHTPPLLALLRSYFASFYFAVLPTGLVGDAHRGYEFRALFSRPGVAYGVVFAERLLGLSALMSLSLIARFVGPETVRLPPVYDALCAIGSMSPLIVLGASTMLRRPGPDRETTAIQLLRSVNVLGPVGRWLIPGFAFSMLMQLASVFCIHVLLVSVCPEVSLLTSARVVPLLLLGTIIPLTPAGVGQHEAVFVHLLGMVSVSPANALAVAALHSVVGLSYVGSGALAHFARTRKAAAMSAH